MQTVVDEHVQRNIDWMNLYPPGLDLGEVKDVVDQCKQLVSADQDLSQVLVLSCRQDVL